MFDAVTASDWLSNAVTLFCFFVAQVVAIWLWSRRERRLRDEQEEARREHQLTKMKSMLDKDIDKVTSDVDELRKSLAQSEHRHKQGREQLHGHLRRVEESRPTRQEMEKELGQMRDTILTVKQDLQNEIRSGFEVVGKRFDEFKDYARDLWGNQR
jgi:chromosome segregation ATPase